MDEVKIHMAPAVTHSLSMGPRPRPQTKVLPRLESAAMTAHDPSYHFTRGRRPSKVVDTACPVHLPDVASDTFSEDSWTTISYDGYERGPSEHGKVYWWFKSLTLILFPLYITWNAARSVGYHLMGLFNCCWRHDSDTSTTVMSLALLIYCVGYAPYAVLKACDWDSMCIDFSTPGYNWLMAARFFGKLVTFVHIVLVLAVVKPSTNFINSMPQSQGHINWRFLHVYLGCALILAAVLHGIAHIIRQNSTRVVGVAGYETFELVTGYILFGILLMCYLPFGIIRTINSLKRAGVCRGPWARQIADFFKKTFRNSHHVMFVLFELVYTFHTGNTHPLVLVCLWAASYHFYRLRTEVVKYRFVDGNNKITSKHDPKYVLELMVTFRGNVPINYGYYCVLKHGWALAPFSCVALSQTTMLFRIQKCSFTQALWSSLGDGAQEGSWLRDHLPISFYGPFVSTDCTSGVYRNMAVLVTGTGDAVSNAIVKMQEQRTYWDKVTVIKCGKGRHVPASSHLKEGPNMTDESDFLSHIAQKGQKEGQLFCSLANFNKEALLRMLVVLQTHHFEVVICSGLIAHQIKILKHEKARFKNVTVNWHAVHIESFAV